MMTNNSNAYAIPIVSEAELHHASLLVGEEKILLKGIGSRTWVTADFDSKAAFPKDDNQGSNPITYVVQFETSDELRDFAVSILEDSDSTIFASIQHRVNNGCQGSPQFTARSMEERHALQESTPIPVKKCRASPSGLLWELAENFGVSADGNADKRVLSDSITAALPTDNHGHTKSFDDENSIDTLIARLLGKTKVACGEPNIQFRAIDAQVGENETTQKLLSSAGTLPIGTAESDRSYLYSSPKHRQDKDVVTNQIKSFRAVAEMSVRAALVKHASNKLTNELYFASGLTALAAIATAWQFGALLNGSETQWWKGILCSLATFASTRRLRQVLEELNVCRLKNCS